MKDLISGIKVKLRYNYCKICLIETDLRYSECHNCKSIMSGKFMTREKVRDIKLNKLIE